MSSTRDSTLSLLLTLLWFRFTSEGPIFLPRNNRQSERYCYESPDCGPAKWGGFCQGRKQSPIQLFKNRSSIAIPVPDCLTFDANYRMDENNFEIVNDGHTIFATLNEHQVSNKHIKHFGFDKGYLFSQLHFHWNVLQMNGSEHVLGDKRFPMEIHLVHYKSIYLDLIDAVQKDDPHALSVLAVFVQIGTASNQVLTSLINALKASNIDQKINAGPVAAVGRLNLFELLPSAKGFYRYLGSSTTPMCWEKVLWAVFEEPIEITSEQMDFFRTVKVLNEPQETLRFNNRPIQPLNGRQLYFFHEFTNAGNRKKLNHLLPLSIFVLFQTTIWCVISPL